MSNFAEIATLTADPELRFTPSGRAVAQMRLAINSGYRNADGQWVDNDATFLDDQLWNGAENAAESLHKATRVLVIGDIRTRSWEREDGTRGAKTYLEVEAIGPDLTFATAKVESARPPGAGRTLACP